VPAIGCVHSPGAGLGCSDHFQCYEVKPATFSTPPVTSVDRFGSQTLTPGTRTACAPRRTRTRGHQRPGAAPGRLRGARTPFVKQKGLVIANQFGTTRSISPGATS
jgi:hypothetical protein